MHPSVFPHVYIRETSTTFINLFMTYFIFHSIKARKYDKKKTAKI